MAGKPEGTVAGRYGSLESLRSPYLRRARDAARLTIPALFPEQGTNGSTNLYQPYQSLGARGVNNLASKLLLSLLPPNSPFFRLQIDDFALLEMTKQPGMRAEVEKAFGMIERTVMTEIESRAMRVFAFEMLKQLLVSGNSLVLLGEKPGTDRVFRLDQYVVKRDVSGNVLEVIIKEQVAPAALSAELRQTIGVEVDNDKPAAEKSIDLYTRILRNGNHWEITQEAKGKPIPQSRGTWPLDKPAFLALRFCRIDGEDYGRGYVEEYYGDLASLEGLSQAIVEGSAAAAKVLFLVNPNGTTEERVIAEAPNGAVRSGNAADVTVLQMGKYADFKIAHETIGDISQRLAFAFLLNTAIQRAGERVTAEEIRFMAGELESALGGVYSILSQEFQLPLVNRLMFQMERTKRLPTLPKGLVRPSIVTGLEALGRGNDLTKLMQLGKALQETFGPEGAARALHPDDFASRVGTALGIDMQGLVISPEERQAMEQAQQQQQMMAQLGPQAVTQLGGIAREGMKGQANQQQQEAQLQHEQQQAERG